jgi:hypothetical protein
VSNVDRLRNGRDAFRCSGQLGRRPGDTALTIINLAEAGERGPDRLRPRAQEAWPSAATDEMMPSHDLADAASAPEH